MRNHEIKFKNNQFILVHSNAVLHLRPNANFFISGDNADFLEKDFLDYDLKPIQSEKKN